MPGVGTKIYLQHLGEEDDQRTQGFIPGRWYLDPNMANKNSAFAPFSTSEEWFFYFSLTPKKDDPDYANYR